MKSSMFCPPIGDVNFNLALANNFAAVTNPGVSDDTTAGYEAGSVWLNVSTGASFTCMSNADGAAVWVQNAGTASLAINSQPAPAAKTVSGVMTAANLMGGLITVTQGAGAASAQQLPTGSALQTALGAGFAVNDSFDFSVINLGTTGEVASITVNTDVTIVGNAAIPIPATGVQSSARFRVRKTADHVFVVYRIA